MAARKLAEAVQTALIDADTDADLSRIAELAQVAEEEAHEAAHRRQILEREVDEVTTNALHNTTDAVHDTATEENTRCCCQAKFWAHTAEAGDKAATEADGLCPCFRALEQASSGSTSEAAIARRHELHRMLQALHQERVTLAQAEARLTQFRGAAAAQAATHMASLAALAAASEEDVAAVAQLSRAERWLLELVRAQDREEDDGAVACFDLETGQAAAGAARRHGGEGREAWFSFSTQCEGFVARAHVTGKAGQGGEIAWSMRLPKAEAEGAKRLRAPEPAQTESDNGGRGQEGALRYIQDVVWPEMRAASRALRRVPGE